MKQRVMPKLIDARRAAEELGVPKSVVVRVMRRCEKVQPEGVRRVFVRRDEFIQKWQNLYP